MSAPLRSPALRTSHALRTLAAATVALASVLLAHPPAEAATPERAMWVWTQPPAKTLVSFAKRHSAQDLFLSVPPNLPSSSALSWVRSVSKAARGTGIRLHALGGDPGWIDDPAAALAWQEAALSTGLFTGSHVDVEPWGHPAWDTDRAGTVARYLDLLGALEASTALPVEADVAFWLHTVGTDEGRSLDAAVLDRVDAVTIMSYRNTVTGADSITDVGATTLATAAAAGKPARLAVETRYLGDDAISRKQTFYGQSDVDLATALQQVDAAEAGSPSYAGISVHDYAGWDALPG